MQRSLHRLPARLRGERAHGITFAREALVQLDDCPAQTRLATPQLEKRLDQVGLGVQVLESSCQLDTRFAEHLAAARLRAEVLQLRIQPIQRNTQEDRQFPLERRRVEDRHVGLRGIDDRAPDALHQAGPFEDLLREWTRRRIVRAQHRQTFPRVARRDAHQQPEVIVKNQRVHGLRGDVNDVRLWIAQPDQQHQQSLFVEWGADEFPEFALVERHRRYDHRGVAPVVAGRQGAPDFGKAGLEPLEGGNLVFEGEATGERRLGDHAGRARRSAIS